MKNGFKFIFDNEEEVKTNSGMVISRQSVLRPSHDNFRKTNGTHLFLILHFRCFQHEIVQIGIFHEGFHFITT
jgi:hypothetical protein